MAMAEGMMENSLPFEGASDVVLSLDEEGFLRRRLLGFVLGLAAESVRVRLSGSSLREPLSR